MTVATSSPLRWLDPRSYSPDWASRSAEMLAMVDRSIEGAANLSFSEYGCGPYSPFATAVRSVSSRLVHRCDLRQWDEEVIACDLNDDATAAPVSDVGVVSGVLEYLDDMSCTLARLSRLHRYLSASYAFRTASPPAAARQAEIDHRCSVNGWVNHLTAQDVVNLFSSFGRVIEISTWNERQMLLLLQFRDD